MIKTLHIKNYLLIEEVELDFESGLTVITGETGAGKSLIIDSLELALGARADPGLVRSGSEKAEFFVTFDAESQQIRDWLQEHELDDGSEVILQRTIFRERPSRAYINGRPVSLNMLKDLASRVIVVHGQSEHQSLQKTATQRYLLDGFADILPSTQRLADLAAQIRLTESERLSHSERLQRYNEELKLLEHQYSELTQLQPQEGEFSDLKQELIRMTHASELATNLGQVSHELFYGDETTLSTALADCIRRIDKLADVDNSLAQYSELLAEAQVRIDDAAREILAIAERTEYDPGQIAVLEERMAALQRQARIHGVNADELLDVCTKLEEQINTVQAKLSEIVDSDKQLENLKSEYRSIALHVTEIRRKAAVQLGEAVTLNMQNLGMVGGQFSVEFVQQSPDSFAGFGNENIRFIVSTTPGQEAGPLSTVASGGELSRLSLSIQVVAANLTQVPAIVFDEIDVGIGGKVAERVGHLLRMLGESVQIFCITHLPQVAAKGDQQLNTTKTEGAQSSIQVQQLDGQQRVMEIARMLSGAKITERTTEHAKELLAQNTI